MVAALEWAAEEFEARTGTKCRLQLPSEPLAIDQERATAIFRIFQEALTNVARHSNATQVDVRLAAENGHLTLEVHDNGVGADEERLSSPESLGVMGMRERAVLLGGEFTINTERDQGTRYKSPHSPTRSVPPSRLWAKPVMNLRWGKQLDISKRIPIVDQFGRELTERTVWV